MLHPLSFLYIFVQFIELQYFIQRSKIYLKLLFLLLHQTQNVSDQAWLILHQCKCISIPYVMLPQLLYISIMYNGKINHIKGLIYYVINDFISHYTVLLNSGSPSWLLKQRCLWQGCCLSLPCYCTCPARFVYFLTETVQ